MTTMDGGVMSIVEWAITHGVPGVLVVVCVMLLLMVRKMKADNDELHAERVADLKDFIAKSEAMQDKLHKTADDLARFVDFSNARRPR